MGDPMVDRLVAKRDHAVAQIEAIKEQAIDGDRDLDERDLESIETYKRSITDYDKQLAVIGEQLQMDDEARSRLALVAPQIGEAQHRYRSDGELLWDALHASSDDDARRRYRSALKRAAEHMGTDKAVTTATAGDLQALYLTPVVGPVIRTDDASMPFITALGRRQMPAGTAFERPYITDAGFATGIGEQAAQKAELASSAFEASTELVSRTTLGGYLNVSRQMEQWHPGSLGIVVDQMRRRLSSALEAFAIAELENSTGSEDLAAGADAGAVRQALYNASAAVYDSTGQLATWVLMGPLGWARLGGLTDAAGRAAFPNLSPSNADGSMSAARFGSAGGVAGLTPVVSPKITDDSFWVGNGLVMECYLYEYPVLDAIEPSVLGRQVAVAADIVALRPTSYANAAIHVFDAP